jgi:hypothetical protein
MLKYYVDFSCRKSFVEPRSHVESSQVAVYYEERPLFILCILS